MTAARGTRLERDSLGERAIPIDAYWGVHTERARENFGISGIPLSSHPDLVRALALVKQAAVRANRGLGRIPPTIAGAIDRACQQIIDGAHHDAFIVDVIQGGAGTSSNMNANEVIANVALESMGRPRGDYDHVGPIDHVNLSQSTNDVYPTALKLALITATHRYLIELEALQHAFELIGIANDDVVKIGRTQLQDAVPMTVGQELTAFAVTIGEDVARLREVIPLLSEINLGATAIGTGITAPSGYRESVRAQLEDISGIQVVTARHLVEATSDTGVFLTLSGTMKRSAVKLSKICNDLRLLSSGPQAGLGELILPPRQAGSSIMPGKVNPVIPEAMNQIAFAMIGADATVTAAVEAGQLQLNAFGPIIADSLLRMLAWLTNGVRTLRIHCVEGIAVDRGLLADRVARNVGLVTAFVPLIGYAAAAELAQAALRTGAPIVDLLLADERLDLDRLQAALASAVANESFE